MYPSLKCTAYDEYGRDDAPSCLADNNRVIISHKIYASSYTGSHLQIDFQVVFSVLLVAFPPGPPSQCQSYSIFIIAEYTNVFMHPKRLGNYNSNIIDIISLQLDKRDSAKLYF